MGKIVGIICLLFTLAVTSTCTYKGIELKQNCTGYLKQAADANTVETASEQLSKSIDYLEKNDLTKGYTSVIWNTPDEDIGFFYNNLKSSQEELLKVNDSTSSLEKTNVLMKLRETLMDNSGERGDNVTCPDGLSRYPNNGLFGVLALLSLVTLLIGLILLSLEL